MIWAKVREQLPAAPAADPRVFAWRFWAPVAGLAAVILVAFLGGRLWRTATPAVPDAAPGDVARLNRELVLLTALEDHFDQTERLLVELKNTPDTKDAEIGRASCRERV